MHDRFEELLPISVLLLFLLLLLLSIFSNTCVHHTRVQCTIGSFTRILVFLFLLLFRAGSNCNFCFNFLIVLLVFLLFLLLGTFCLNIVDLDLLHIWLFFIII